MSWQIKGTDFFVGSLYDGRHGKEIPTFIPDEKAEKSSLLYDEKPENLHLFPKDARLAEKLSGEYREMRDAAAERLKSKGAAVKGKGSGTARIVNGTDYEKSGSLFCFVQMQAGDLLFDLTFFRFFRETRGGETFVSCMARTPQVKVYPAGGSEPHSLSHYPDSGEDGTDNGVYYNLPCSEGAGAEEIAEAFLAFAEKKSGIAR